MRKRDKDYLIKAYKVYQTKSSKGWKAGLGEIYKTCSEEKQLSYEKIKNYLRTNYAYYDLRCLYGNTFNYTCGAIAKDNNNTYFMVWNRDTFRCCCEFNGNLIDENGVIFYEKSKKG